jgi:hypothetical protein
MSRDTSLLWSGINGEQRIDYSSQSILTDSLLGIVYFLSTLVPLPFIERSGRRILLLIGAVGQCVTMAILAAMTQDIASKAKGYVAAVMLL